MKSDKQIIPYIPVTYSNLEARIFNLVSSRDLRFQMPFGKQTISITIGFDKTDLPYQKNAAEYEGHLAFKIGDELCQITFQKMRSLYDLFENTDSFGFFDGTPPESVPDDILWAMLEAYLTKNLGKMESILAETVTIAAPVNPIEMDSFNLPFEISFDTRDGDRNGAFGFLTIPLTSTCVNRIENLFASFPGNLWKPETVSDLLINVFFEAGRVKLNVEELRNMGVGDVLIPDRWYLKENRLAMRVANDLFFGEYDGTAMAMTIEAKGSAMDESFENMPVSGQTERLGTDDMTEDNVQADGLNPAGNLELDLVFEVGKTTMTIEQIGLLAKGQVIQLSHKLDAGLPVEIKANGQLVAQGKIVGLGDEFGVQITRTAGQ